MKTLRTALSLALAALLAGGCSTTRQLQVESLEHSTPGRAGGARRHPINAYTTVDGVRHRFDGFAQPVPNDSIAFASWDPSPRAVLHPYPLHGASWMYTYALPRADVWSITEHRPDVPATIGVVVLAAGVVLAVLGAIAVGQSGGSMGLEARSGPGVAVSTRAGGAPAPAGGDAPPATPDRP